MSMHRGGQNRARQKKWPGAGAAEVRELKRAQGDIDEAKLLEHIVLPDWEKRLLPLFLFRGTDPYRIRALENIVYGMFLAEAESRQDALRLLPHDGLAHLCGLHAAPTHNGLRGIFGRLRGCKKYTDSISPAFTEYIEWVHPYPCVYVPVPYYSKDRCRYGWWREPIPLTPRLYNPKPIATVDLSYPFIRECRPEHDIVLKVEQQIPSRIVGDLRSDMCQDLLVAVLSGEITIDEVPQSIKRFASKAREIAPNRWRDVSIDSFSSEEEKHRFVNAYIDHTDDFAPDLINALCVHEEESGVPAANWNEEGVIHRRIGGRGQYRGYTRVCKDKRQFEDREAASIFLQLQPEIERVRMHPYHCGFCRLWHLGHDVDKQEKYREEESAHIAPRRTQAEIRESEARMHLEERKQDVRRRRPKWKMIRGEWA